MITFKANNIEGIKTGDMEIGQTGIVVGSSIETHLGASIMKIYNGTIISLTNGNCIWEDDPDFKVRICDFELREI